MESKPQLVYQGIRNNFQVSVKATDYEAIIQAKKT